MLSLCAFVFVHNFTGPWPQSIYDTVPERIWFLGHVIGGMLFGGGVIVTTCAEWLVHIIYALWMLLVFAVWRGFIDLTTQGRALEAVTTISNNNSNKNNDKDTTDVSKPRVLKEAPEVMNERILRNVICCVLVFVLYAIKLLKPGTLCFL
ncbi:hypothetical protein FRACYDRAFT_243124 [Fragilariopsis cylindrus CCMP1102]|uniref:Uncharacterized protein n=1 Tax=Fragilariopsis cylindrus CCMP1102 TaxID=635003 RepID=A0A1E7F429_9STRA|nr:hypothetical protein FRACYDRAFT_243124 [Fragilariopsis cylindrus CCMP1102]|eukprot:OEU12941.1 hypothetical protein FRACYDRAFT_243124 [Fragilariopsis cylindrus CCMP1102]